MLTDLQQKKLSRYFRVYDIDDDGHIGPADFERVVENVRMLHGLKDGSAAHQRLRDGYAGRWRDLRAVADADDDGAVDLEEWLAYWSSVLGSDEHFQREVGVLESRFFEIFDIDEDGYIGPDEFCNFFSCYGFSAAQARQVFMDLDANGDGQVTHDELMEMAMEFYRGDDPQAPGNKLFGPLDE